MKFFTSNTKANKYSSAARKSRASLYKEMCEMDISQFFIKIDTPDGVVTLKASRDTSTRVVVDVEKLREILDDRTFMKVISASQTAVKAEVGTSTLAEVSVEVEGAENVNVKKI